MRKYLLIGLLCLLICLTACSDISVKEYKGFSVDTSRSMILFPDREFYYTQKINQVDGEYSITIYYDYNKQSNFNEWSLHFKREKNDSLTRIEAEDFDANQWVGYDMEAVAQEILPRNRVFFTELTIFMFKPWGMMFLYGCANVLLNKELMSLPMRVRRYSPYVPYDECIHDHLCLQWGIGIMIGSVVWWFVECILMISVPLPLGVVVIILCLPKREL